MRRVVYNGLNKRVDVRKVIKSLCLILQCTVLHSGNLSCSVSTLHVFQHNKKTKRTTIVLYL